MYSLSRCFADSKWLWKYVVIMYGYIPKSISFVSISLHDELVIFVDLHLFFVEVDVTSIVTELTKRYERGTC